MNSIRMLAKKIPGLRPIYLSFIEYQEKRRLKGKMPDEVFTEIYNKNRWQSNESASGPGSVLRQTKVVLDRLPALLSELSVKTMLDIPSGDFNWLRNADFRDVDYTGADIVEAIMETNLRNFEREKLSFKRLNLLADELPEVDLVFCRDCLVHFSFDDIRTALTNICSSRSTYLLTTSFTDRIENRDILTGQWRPLNLEVEPFNLPKPFKFINEGCTEGDGVFYDKSLCLWRIDSIAERLQIR